MDYFGKKLFSAIAIFQKAHMDTGAEIQSGHGKDHHRPPRERNTGIPSIPTDIGYNSGKASGGSHSTGFMANAASNPAVILGMGLTTLALLGMIRRSVLGDKLGTQKYMRYRIMAQFFTVTALVAGVTIFATTAAAKPPKDEIPVVAVASGSSGN